jgi:HEAT repeat protein
MQPNSEQLSLGSYKAIGLLGNRANPAFDDLCRVLNDAYPGPQTLAAASEICRFGPVSLRPLLTVGSNALHPARVIAIVSIGLITNIGNAAEPAVLALTNWLASSNWNVQMVAAGALGNLKAAPQISVPALVSVLTNSNPQVRQSAAISLSRFGPQARSALPALTNALTYPDRTFPIVVRYAIQKITGTLPKGAPDL